MLFCFYLMEQAKAKTSAANMQCTFVYVGVVCSFCSPCLPLSFVSLLLGVAMLATGTPAFYPLLITCCIRSLVPHPLLASSLSKLIVSHNRLVLRTFLLFFFWCLFFVPLVTEFLPMSRCSCSCDDLLSWSGLSSVCPPVRRSPVSYSVGLL